MQRLKTALEQLDDMITALEDKIGTEAAVRRAAHKKLDDQLKESRAREAQVLAVAQKVATRLDKTIAHIENVVRN